MESKLRILSEKNTYHPTKIILGAMLSDTLSGAREGALGNTIPRDNNTYHDNPRHVWMPLNQINPLTYR